jgi:peptide/nickel transport system ATP-binding protein
MTNNNHNLLLEVKDLKTYFFLNEGTVRAVDGVSFTIERGKTLGVVGESGCGKSITARSILGMIRPPGRTIGGEIIYHQRVNGQGSQTELIDLTKLNPTGAEIREIRWKSIAMIFQEPMTSLSPVHTIGDQITEAIMLHLKVDKKEAGDRAIEMLRRVGLPQPRKVLERYRHQLSGGMRQRAMIAMALSCNPELLIADEPTTALDVTTQAQILELMKSLQEEYQMAIMFITHDLGVIAEMADEVVVMYMGKEVELADVDTIFYHPGHPYTKALLRSIPSVEQKVNKLETIKGSVPDPYSVPAGCAFHPRCPFYQADKCADPEFIAVRANHWARCNRVFEIDGAFDYVRS